MTTTHTIEIDNEIREMLRRQCDFGETEPMVLRRILVQVEEQQKAHEESRQNKKRLHEHSKMERRFSKLSAFQQFVMAGGSIPPEMTTTDVYLHILAFAYREKGEDAFRKMIEMVSGRKRKYFGTEEEIERSGSNTFPQSIPDSPFCALTNASTVHKRFILRQALGILGYSQDEIERAAQRLWEGHGSKR